MLIDRISNDFNLFLCDRLFQRLTLFPTVQLTISKITLIAFKQNLAGNIFWKSQNWKQNKDINSYELVLNEENISSIVA